MVNYYIAYTQPINPQGITPVLNGSQLWAGLQRKVRHAYEFVPGFIVSCDVVSDENNIVKRVIQFDDSGKFGKERPTKPVMEICKEFAPIEVDFHQEDDSVIKNIISHGPGGGDDDLYMTYTFELFRPEIVARSKEYGELVEKYEKISKTAVDSTIAVIRKLVVAGEL